MGDSDIPLIRPSGHRLNRPIRYGNSVGGREPAVVAEIFDRNIEGPPQPARAVNHLHEMGSPRRRQGYWAAGRCAGSSGARRPTRSGPPSRDGRPVPERERVGQSLEIGRPPDGSPGAAPLRTRGRRVERKRGDR